MLLSVIGNENKWKISNILFGIDIKILIFLTMGKNNDCCEIWLIILINVYDKLYIFIYIIHRIFLLKAGFTKFSHWFCLSKKLSKVLNPVLYDTRKYLSY